MTTSPRKRQSPMDDNSSDSSALEDESEDEALVSSKQYKENKFKLNWFSMREKQIKVAIYYEKCRKTVPFIEDSDLLCKKIAELKIELEEVKNDKRMKDLMCSQGQIADILQKIVGPKNSKAKQSRYSEDQIKCIKDLLQKKKTLTKQRNLKQKEILSLEEGMETLQKRKVDLKGKKKRKKGDGDPPHTNSKELEKFNEKSRQLASRCHLLAKAIHSLSTHYMSMEQQPKNKNLASVVFSSSLIMQSQLDDMDDIHNLLIMVHNLNV